MDLFNLYLLCLLVGGFFVVLSIFGGSDSEADADADFDTDFDADADFDADFDADAHFDAHVDVDTHADLGAGPGFVDLFSIRALFLFAAFFGLTGLVLTALGSGEPLVAILSTMMGLAVGLGGNYVIKRVGYEHVSSDVGVRELQGRTARVMIPFEGASKGKISVVAKGHRLQLMARSFGEDSLDAFEPGDEVVVVRMNGSVAEVVKPE